MYSSAKMLVVLLAQWMNTMKLLAKRYCMCGGPAIQDLVYKAFVKISINNTAWKIKQGYSSHVWHLE